MLKKLNRQFLFIFLSVTGWFILPRGIFAQESWLSGGEPPPDWGDFMGWAGDAFKRIIALAYPISVIVAVGVIVYGGYMWMFSSGDPAKLKQAQGTLTWGVIGLVFLGIIGMILQLVFDFFFN